MGLLVELRHISSDGSDYVAGFGFRSVKAGRRCLRHDESNGQPDWISHMFIRGFIGFPEVSESR